MKLPQRSLGSLVVGLSLAHGLPAGGQEWGQLKFDCRRSGNVPDRQVATPLGLVGAVPLTDAVLTAPIVVGGRVYAVDGAGVAFCIDARSLEVLWRVATRGGPVNVGNVSSPAMADGYLHFGTAAGAYYVLEAATGKVVREIACGEPILSAPAVSEGRVYFATLGSRVYALEKDGAVCWTWDMVKDVLKFPGDRWSGKEWLAHKKGRVTWRDIFGCSIDIACHGKTVILSAGGKTIWLEDAGREPKLRAVGLMPPYAGEEDAAAFGLSVGEEGEVYRQWHRRDNSGRLEVLRLQDGKVATDFVPGTQTAISLPGHLSFCSVSVRGRDVYRCRPEGGLGFLRHRPGTAEPQNLGAYPSIAPPILLRDQAIVGGLDGTLYGVPLDGAGGGWSFQTAFGCPISAPPCVADGRIYFGCEDGYLYVLGPGGKAALPAKDLEVWKVRHPLTSPLADARYDWFTNHGDFANTNTNNQQLRPPLVMKWIRRYEGTFKHVPVCGGGRLYTHTAEGQIIAVEQETGRPLWRRYWPDTYLSFTSPLYYRERLLLPQAGMKASHLRCLDAATGKQLWEAPFTGSPSWSRQAPPVVHGNLAIYAFGSGVYAAQGSAKPFIFKGTPQEDPAGREVMSWIYTHDNPYYPKDNLPLIRAWDIQTGKEVWRRDFADLGIGGNDCGLCLMDGKLYYSTFFGYDAKRKGEPGPRGVTAALDPATGQVIWKTTDYYVTAGCTISGRDGRLYLGGYNRPNGQTQDRFVWCLDARDGSLVWQSEPVRGAVNVIAAGDEFIFANASGGDGCTFDRKTGKITSRFNFKYACTRFTVSTPFVLGANMDMIDLSAGNALATSGPAIDSRECVGAIVSNGRVFYTSQASGLQCSLMYGPEAAAAKLPWFQGESR